LDFFSRLAKNIDIMYNMLIIGNGMGLDSLRTTMVDWELSVKGQQPYKNEPLR
jgi:hypothetical protein